jgi:hypothetical protein
MRVAVAALVALLLHFVEEHFNDARYTRAATAMLAQIARSADMTTLSAKGLLLSV